MDKKLYIKLKKLGQKVHQYEMYWQKKVLNTSHNYGGLDYIAHLNNISKINADKCQSIAFGIRRSRMIDLLEYTAMMFDYWYLKNLEGSDYISLKFIYAKNMLTAYKRNYLIARHIARTETWLTKFKPLKKNHLGIYQYNHTARVSDFPRTVIEQF